MPKLRGLIVEGDVDLEPALLARCTNLEAIRFEWCSISLKRTIATLTRLTSLDIRWVYEDGDEDEDQDEDEDDIFWLGHLRSLQALRICAFYENLSLIGNLTGLTGLTLFEDVVEYPTHSIAPLTRLTRLRSLHIEWHMTESNLGIACSLGSGPLADLEVWVCEEASADCGRFLSRQTALTRLILRGPQLCNLRHIGAIRIELLQCLKFDDIYRLDAEGLSVLCGATSLSELSIAASNTQPEKGLSQVLAGLTQLRSLTLAWLRWRDDDPNILDLSLALTSLTALTKLHLSWHRLNDGELGAILVLTGLRVLELRSCRLTDDVLPELAVLTSLSSLTIVDDGVTSLVPVSEALDPLRNARGLPPLHIRKDRW